MDNSRMFLLAAGGLLAMLALRIFSPFLGTLLASASVALLLAPLHRRLVARAPRHPTQVALGITGTISLLVAVPLLLGGWVLLREAADAYPAAKVWVEAISDPDGPAWTPAPRWSGVVEKALGYAEDFNLEPRALVLDNLDRVSSWAGKFAGSIAKNAAFVLLHFAVFMASLFMFLRDGERLVERVTALIPLPEEKKAHLLTRVRDVMLAVVNGIFALALLQGFLAWIGLVIFRVPFSFLLGALCTALSPIPFIGSTLVWVPVVAYLAFTGATGKAGAVALWFLIVVGLSDNLLRPVLLGTQMKLPIPLVFVAVIGAMQAFGLSGLFIGPLVIALAIGLLDIIQDRTRGA